MGKISGLVGVQGILLQPRTIYFEFDPEQAEQKLTFLSLNTDKTPVCVKYRSYCTFRI